MEEILKNLQECDLKIVELRDLRQKYTELLLTHSDFKVGDKVQRTDGFAPFIDFYISKVWWDHESNVFRYGVKTDLNTKIDSYACLTKNNLMLI